MLFENYYGFKQLINIDTNEIIEQEDINTENSAMLRSIIEMHQETEARSIIMELRKDDLVDNIQHIYKAPLGPKLIWMAIGYHQYQDGETPCGLDPNRMWIFGIASEKEILRIHEMYGDDPEKYEQAVSQGLE